MFFGIRRRLTTWGCFALVAAGVSATQGGEIYSAQSVVSAPPAASGSWTATINQAGLATTYTSGVTDFDAYIGLGPQHTGDNTTHGFTTSNPPVSITFDMGAVLPVTRVAFWNYRFTGSASVKEMSIDTSTDISFTMVSSVGTFFPAQSGNPVPVQVFDVVDTFARFVRLNLLQRHGPSGVGIGYSEIAFEVPEPAMMPAIAVALIALHRKRRVPVAGRDKQTK